jgi:hypothetical protein
MVSGKCQKVDESCGKLVEKVSRARNKPEKARKQNRSGERQLHSLYHVTCFLIAEVSRMLSAFCTLGLF